jgi:hypothetical protein
MFPILAELDALKISGSMYSSRLLRLISWQPLPEPSRRTSREALAVGLLARPLCDRLFIEVQLTADLGKA